MMNRLARGGLGQSGTIGLGFGTVAAVAASRVLGARELAALVGDWAGVGGGRGALSARLAFALRSVILSGVLPAGTRLPPERAVAQSLAVSRTTVTSALDQLRGEGLVVSRQGSGTAGAGRGDDPIGAVTTTIARLRGSVRAINLSSSTPPGALHLPPLGVGTEELLRVPLAETHDPLGLPRLRIAIAERYTRRGSTTEPEEIVVTAGAQQGLGVVFSVLTEPGDTVLVEDPTYPGIFDLLRTAGVKPVALPCDEHGVVVEQVAPLVRRYRPRAAYLMPAVHNPTGRVLARSQRRRLASTLDDTGLTVIEDDVLAELTFQGSRPPSLATLCRQASVVAVESVSKVAWDGLRIGWLRGPRGLVERLARQRGAADLGTSIPSQLLTLQLLSGYDELCRDRRLAMEQAAARLRDRLAERLPDWRVAPPGGGLSLWVRLPGIDGEAFAQVALRHGVSLAPGTVASPEGGRHYIRLCFDRAATEIDQAVERLEAAWSAMGGRPRIRG